jgi:hypothetical protein|tara:strand:- start:70 stop:966 length:897 start_codon:yes stop_codon:yes gene_type:complete
MFLYNSEQRSGASSSSILKHFGSSQASARRVESMFAARSPCGFDGSDSVVLYSHNQLPRRLSHSTVLEQFSEFAKDYVISGYQVECHSPLRLNDCWGDDPIGSGGPDILEGNVTLSNEQRAALVRSFGPFTSTIYPPDVSYRLSKADLKALRQKSQSNRIFKVELAKRKGRIAALGLDLASELPHELVWIDFTLKLRFWALENGFDSFIYTNNGEDQGNDSFVTLQENQTSRAQERLCFNKEKYLDLVSPIFGDFLRSQYELEKQNKLGIGSNSTSIHHHMFWAGVDPMSFWEVDKSL